MKKIMRKTEAQAIFLYPLTVCLSMENSSYELL
jgi:hypothetical protein